MTSHLSPRATIARLTLQLRAAQRELDDAERAEREWDGEAAASELRSRLEPMMREQQRVFELEVWRARAAAAARVAAVRKELESSRREPDAPAIDAEEPIDVVEPTDVVEPNELAAPERVVEPTHVVEPIDGDELPAPVTPGPFGAAVPFEESSEPIIDVPDAGVPGSDEVSELSPPVVVPWDAPEPSAPDAPGVPGSDLSDVPVEPDPAPESPHVVGMSRESAVGTRSGRDDDDWRRPAPEQPVPVTADDVRSIVDEAIERFAARQAAHGNAGMDPEAFSRAFAAAFGAAFSTMLDDRIAALNAGPAVAPPWLRYPTAPVQVEVKKSFWTNMWHADVMLSVLAAVIVLVILIAWST